MCPGTACTSQRICAALSGVGRQHSGGNQKPEDETASESAGKPKSDKGSDPREWVGEERHGTRLKKSLDHTTETSSPFFSIM